MDNIFIVILKGVMCTALRDVQHSALLYVKMCITGMR